MSGLTRDHAPVSNISARSARIAREIGFGSLTKREASPAAQHEQCSTRERTVCNPERRAHVAFTPESHLGSLRAARIVVSVQNKPSAQRHRRKQVFAHGPCSLGLESSPHDCHGGHIIPLRPHRFTTSPRAYARDKHCRLHVISLRAPAKGPSTRHKLTMYQAPTKHTLPKWRSFLRLRNKYPDHPDEPPSSSPFLFFSSFGSHNKPHTSCVCR